MATREEIIGYLNVVEKSSYSKLITISLAILADKKKQFAVLENFMTERQTRVVAIETSVDVKNANESLDTHYAVYREMIKKIVGYDTTLDALNGRMSTVVFRDVIEQKTRRRERQELSNKRSFLLGNVINPLATFKTDIEELQGIITS